MAGEKNLQEYFKRQAKAAGCLWYKIRAEGVNGLPDVMLIYKGTVMLLELKNPNGAGRASEQQLRRIQEFNDHNITSKIISTKGMVDAIIKEITTI